ncbi:MAG: ferritin-like domain-containing protein [Desulfovermiculus sp.]
MNMLWNRRHIIHAGVYAAGLITLGPVRSWSQHKPDSSTTPNKGEKHNLSQAQEKIALALQHEHGAIIQYINHCGKLTAGNLKPQAQKIQTIIDDEVAHAQALVHILSHTGIEPTLAVWPPKTDAEPTTMLQQDIAAEQGAISLYQDLLTEKWPAPIHRKLQWMLEQEQQHKDIFRNIVDTL